MDKQKLQNSIWLVIILSILGIFLSQLTPKDSRETKNDNTSSNSQEQNSEPTDQKVYRQEIIGFEIKLPNDWKVQADIGEAVSFVSLTDQTLGLSVAIVDGSLDEIRKRIRSNNETVSEQPTFFVGKPAVIIIHKNVTGTNTKQILIPWIENKTLLIAGRDVEIINNILSSLKFN